eukprot:m51a1_g2167 hypothetical protein (301) ;mRNA; f:53282-54184
MPGTKKRAARAEEDARMEEAPMRESESDSEPESGSSSDLDSASSGSDVDVDFDLFNQREYDFLALRALLSGLLGGRAYDVGGLADLVVRCPVGSVVKSDGEAGDALGVACVLDMSASERAMAEVRAHVVASSAPGAGAELDRARRVLAGGRVGLVLNERLVNMPAQVAPAMLRTLFDEVGEELPSGTYDHYVFICPYFIPVAKAHKQPPHKRAKPAPKAAAAAAAAAAPEGKREFKREEEEVIAEAAEFTVPLPPPVRAGEDASGARWTFAGTAREAYLAAFVRAKDMPAVLKRIEELCV